MSSSGTLALFPCVGNVALLVVASVVDALLFTTSSVCVWESLVAALSALTNCGLVKIKPKSRVAELLSRSLLFELFIFLIMDSTFLSSCILYRYASKSGDANRTCK